MKFLNDLTWKHIFYTLCFFLFCFYWPHNAAAYWFGQSNQSGETNLSDEFGTRPYLTFEFYGTTTIQSLTLKISGSCSGSGYPKLCTNNTLNCTGELDDIDIGETPEIYTFENVNLSVYPENQLTTNPPYRFTLQCGVGTIEYWGVTPAINQWQTPHLNYLDENIEGITSSVGAVLDGTLYYILETDTYTDTFTYNYDNQLQSDIPDFATVENQICFLDEQCRLWFSFNSLALGSDMHAIYYSSSTIPSNAISTTIIQSSPIWQNYLVIPDPKEEGQIKYNMLMDTEGYGWTIKTGINIDWYSSSTFYNILDDKLANIKGDFCDNVCEGISTSSDFMYSINCGLRQVFCWLFIPTNDSITYLSDQNEELKKSFPFNLVFDFLTKGKNIIENSATSTFEMVMPYMKAGDETITSKVIFTSTSTEEVLGSENYEILDESFRHAIWIFTGFFTLLIVIYSFRII